MEKTLWSWQGYAKRQDKNKYFWNERNFYLWSSVVVSCDQIFSHLHYVLETILASIDFNFPGLMLFNQYFHARYIPWRNEDVRKYLNINVHFP